MKKNKVILLGIIIVAVIAFAVWAGILIAGVQSGPNPDAASPYSAVYLSTGDIYFGKISWFPSPHMTDVWLITRSQGQNGQTQTSLIPFKSVFWGPTDEIYFNAQDVVFSTRLRNGSQLVQAFGNPQLLQQIGQQQPQISPGQSQPTSTFKGPSAKPPSK